MGFQLFQMCKWIHQSVSLAHAASREHLVNGHARRHARKYTCMSIYSINSTTIQKEMSREFERCKRSKERGRVRGNAGRMACSPTLTIPKPFGPSHLFVYCYRCNCVGWGPKQATVEGWWGRREWERNKQHLTQVANKILQSLHCTNSVLKVSLNKQLAGFLKA